MEDNLSYMRTEAPLLAPIFRSDGQARLLSTLLLTGDELSLTDLAERAGLAYPTAHREVARLIDAGILSERHVGRTRLIRANDESPLVEPLREILTVVTGPVVILAEELARIDGIEAAFLYGSFAARLLGDAGPAPHDIDLMVLGAPDVDAVYEACTRVEAAVHRPVNPTILTLRNSQRPPASWTTCAAARQSPSSESCRGTDPAHPRPAGNGPRPGRGAATRRRARRPRAGDLVPAAGPRALGSAAAAHERHRQVRRRLDACHDTGEALLAAYGFRTTNGPGQHEALGRYLRAVFDKPPAEKAAREFDRLRRARNQDRYEAKPVGAAATEKAEQVARTLFDAALTRGLST